MGVQDRDWYWEHRRQVERREAAKLWKPSRDAGSPLRFIATWIAVGLVVFGIVRWLDKDLRHRAHIEKSSRAQVVAPTDQGRR